MVAGTWCVGRSRNEAILLITPFEAIAPAAKKDLIDEGERLLRLIDEDASSYRIQIDC